MTKRRSPIAREAMFALPILENPMSARIYDDSIASFTPLRARNIRARP